MHIASTLISAAVGGAFGTGSGGAVVASGAKFHKEKNPKPLLMGASRDERDPERAVSAVR